MILLPLYFLPLLIGNVATENVPVFVLDYESKRSSTSVNPFAKTSNTHFLDLIEEARMRSATIVIFIENQLNAEDVSLKDKQGSPFFHLRQGFKEKKVVFFPSVVDPYKVLISILPFEEFNVFHLRSTTTKFQIFENNYKHFYIFFEDGHNETRADVLRRHDAIMKEVYFVIRQMVTGPVVAFYTGKRNPVFVHRVPLRQDYKTFTNGVLKFFSNTTLFKFRGMNLLAGGRRWALNHMPHVVDEVVERDFIATQLSFSNFVLQFNFRVAEKDWTLTKIGLLEAGEEVGHVTTDIGAPWGSSYACREPLHIINKRDGSLVTIADYQIEPIQSWLRTGGVGSRRHFLRTVSCLPYFNRAILECLFVTFVCFGVLTYGVVMLMGCSGNDRYDDPQGKQLMYTEGVH